MPHCQQLVQHSVTAREDGAVAESGAVHFPQCAAPVSAVLWNVQRTKARCINASEAGILSEGVDVMPLEEVLYRFCGKPVEVSKVVRSSVAKRGPAELKSAAKKLLDIQRELETALKRAESISSGSGGEKELKWLLSRRKDGEVCSVISGVIDWYKQRHGGEVADRTKLEADATAWACRFAIDHIAQAERLLTPDL